MHRTLGKEGTMHGTLGTIERLEPWNGGNQTLGTMEQ